MELDCAVFSVLTRLFSDVAATRATKSQVFLVNCPNDSAFLCVRIVDLLLKIIVSESTDEFTLLLHGTDT